MNFAKAQKIKNKIDSLEREVEPHSLGELLQDYTPEFKVENASQDAQAVHLFRLT